MSLRIKKGDMEFFLSPLLASFRGLIHAFMGRRGGVSQGRFSSLNMSTKVGDREEDVLRNMGIIKEALGMDGCAFMTPRQVHGDEVVVVEECGVGYEAVEADGVITALRGVATGVLTADCVPVLLYDPVREVTGAVHAGWRGTVRCVCEKAVKKMETVFGSDPGDVIALIGPCIGICCYTVGDEVVERFRTMPRCEMYIVNRGGRYRVDLQLANLDGLILSGLKKEHIYTVNICTSCRRDLFFSYRGDGDPTGRQISLIMKG